MKRLKSCLIFIIILLSGLALQQASAAPAQPAQSFHTTLDRAAAPTAGIIYVNANVVGVNEGAIPNRWQFKFPIVTNYPIYQITQPIAPLHHQCLLLVLMFSASRRKR